MEEIQTVDMHTGGESLRIVTKGFPKIEGKTIQDKFKFVRDNLDHIRQRLMYEPRGHQEQYGAILVDADLEECDIGAIFMHTGGYSTMCGHGCIALGRYIVDNNLHKNKESANGDFLKVIIQCPCGPVKLRVEMRNGSSGFCSFVSVPAFCFAKDLKISTRSYNNLTIDIGFGGNFFGIVDVSQLNISLQQRRCEDWRKISSEIITSLNSHVKLEHPNYGDSCYISGIILTGGKDEYSKEPTENVCIFGDMYQIDRSPTGSGVTARLAVQHAKRQIDVGFERKFRNALTKSEFSGKVVEVSTCGKFPAVRIEVTGRAYYCGKMTFFAEKDDPFKNGFLLV